MVPTIAESLMYVPSAKELRSELAERFGEAQGPLIYQLNRDLILLSQGNDPVSMYYSKMKKHWDELQEIDEFPRCFCVAAKACTCDLHKKILDLESRNKLFQFLMGLNSGYDAIKNQILAMDPLPTVNRAYYILQQQEKQRQMKEGMQAIPNAEAYAVHKHGSKHVPLIKKDSKKAKSDKFCQHCKVKGHSIDQCFKIHGYPDWYKEKYGAKLAAQVIASKCYADTLAHESPLDVNEDQPTAQGTNATLINAVCREVLKALKGQTGQAGGAGNMAAGSVHGAFAGPYY